MAYPKNIKETTDFLANYGPVEAKNPVPFTEELDSNLSASLMRTAKTNGALATLAPFSQLERGGADRVVDYVDRIFVEGNAIPNGAADVYTKTVELPSDVDLSNVFGIFVNAFLPSPPVQMEFNFTETLNLFTLSNLSAAGGRLVVFEDYRKTVASFAFTSSAFNVPVPVVKFAVNASYQSLIDANTVMLPSYENSIAAIGAGEEGKSALLSAYFNKEEHTLVFTFKKTGSTSGVSFTAGRFFNVIYLRA